MNTMKKKLGVLSVRAELTEKLLSLDTLQRDAYMNGTRGEEERDLDQAYIKEKQDELIEGIPFREMSEEDVSKEVKEYYDTGERLIYFEEEEEYINKIVYLNFCFHMYKKGLGVPLNFQEFLSREKRPEEENKEVDLEPASVKNKRVRHRLEFILEAIWGLHIKYYEGKIEPNTEVLKNWAEEVEIEYAKENDIIAAFTEGLDERTPVLFDLVYGEGEDGETLPYIFYYYGRSHGLFAYKDGVFLDYEEKETDMKAFWGNYLSVYRTFRKHQYQIMKSLEHLTRDIERDILYGVLLDNLNFINIYFDGCMFEWDFKDGILYRTTGEEILDIPIVVNEIFEVSQKENKHNEEAYKKATHLFLSTLTKEEKEMYAQKQSVFIQGKDYDYIIVSPERIAHNNIIRIPHNENEESKSLCLGVSDHIPRMDVLATIVLLIKSGREDKINETGNQYEIFPSHQQYIDKFAS